MCEPGCQYPGTSKSYHSSTELHSAHFLFWVSLFSPGLSVFSEDKLLWPNYQHWVKGISQHLIFRLLHLTSVSVMSSIQLSSDPGGWGGGENWVSLINISLCRHVGLIFLWCVNSFLFPLYTFLLHMLWFGATFLKSWVCFSFLFLLFWGKWHKRGTTDSMDFPPPGPSCVDINGASPPILRRTKFLRVAPASLFWFACSKPL